ncbi:hypothetical protein (plasmid) [Lactobacillus parabuchneri] [Lactiplantibacillus mudanjiangensis]|uniref:hypothetical protein n=1 Tax=Lactiplantibacillus mudanjiangensis TaxID=1296538 RepID=UPI001014FE61|nr:hypothetical protein (plasmid) [Lactobacillus parabuchneri] [Lactiplantibacillus mudanjiangensis]
MKKRQWVIALVGVLAVGMLSGCGNAAQTSSSTSSKTTKMATSSSASSTDPKLAKDEAILKKAQQLNVDGKYKQSNKQLSSIDLADLSKKGFGALKTEFFALQKSNDKFLLKKHKQSKTASTTRSGTAAASSKTTTPATNHRFDGYSKFVGDYTFYNYDSDRPQSDLSIASDGTVTQNNNDGSAYYGTATIKASSATGILSYDVSTGTNDTKTIHANVEVDVVWDSDNEH